jgi:hypothetical protein
MKVVPVAKLFDPMYSLSIVRLPHQEEAGSDWVNFRGARQSSRVGCDCRKTIPKSSVTLLANRLRFRSTMPMFLT